jgi:hypothetical protein
MNKVIEDLSADPRSEKKKRGRPRLLHAEWEKDLRKENQYCDIRTIQNIDYEARAAKVLGFSSELPVDFPFRWLSDPSKVKAGSSKRRGYRKTILAELGRISSDKNLIEAAHEICKRKPTTRDAIEMIRSWRLRKPYMPDDLETLLRKTIIRFRKKFPEINSKDVYKALTVLGDEFLAKAVEEI